MVVERDTVDATGRIDGGKDDRPEVRWRGDVGMDKPRASPDLGFDGLDGISLVGRAEFDAQRIVLDDMRVKTERHKNRNKQSEYNF